MAHILQHTYPNFSHLTYFSPRGRLDEIYQGLKRRCKANVLYSLHILFCDVLLCRCRQLHEGNNKTKEAWRTDTFCQHIHLLIIATVLILKTPGLNWRGSAEIRRVLIISDFFSPTFEIRPFSYLPFDNVI